MFFQPAIGTGGYPGWLILGRTEARQRETFEKSPTLAQNIEYFRENISKATTAEDLVSDRRLLTVALGAFGLGDEIGKKAFVQRILEGGTEDGRSLANRVSDPRYKKFAEAFDYGNITNGSNILLQDFREDIVARYKSLEFERAVGEVDDDMRLGMNFRREIPEIADPETAETTAWFQIMGQRPLREVLSVALNIPRDVGSLDIDRQAEIFADKAQQLLGDSNPAIFDDPEMVDEVLRRFFLMRQVENGPSAQTPGFAALTLLQSGPIGGESLFNLLTS
ncbi:MAG: flagellar protein [Hyphococcus sp.]|nr:MAG: flagellar protein [Marinicaulis sp.]